MSKFGSLAVDTSQTSRMIIINPRTELPVKDKAGKEAYIEMLGPDSEQARKLDRERGQALGRKLRTGRGTQALDDEDPIEDQIAKLAAVTTGWYLVDPNSGAPIDVPFSQANAVEFYSDPAMGWLRRAAFVHHNTVANFMQGSSKTSSSSRATSSAATAS